MNNIGIILNQDNKPSYLGKFYNRNQLEFPVIRKIYEQIEFNKSNIAYNNKNINYEKKILDINTVDNEYVYKNKNDIEIDDTDKDEIDKYDIDKDDTYNQVNQIADDGIIILDKSNYASVKKYSELTIDTTNLDTSNLDTSNLDTSNLDSSVLDTSHVYTNNIQQSIIEPSNREPFNIEASKINLSITEPPKLFRSYRNIMNNLHMVEFKCKFNNSELIFLWLSSILLIYSSELYIFKNFFS